MSVGRERNQERQFEALRNKALKNAADDLLSKIPPGQERRIDVRSTDAGVRQGVQLHAAFTSDRREVEFRAGGNVYGRTSTAITDELGVRLGSCFFEVVSDTAGILTLRVCVVDRQSVQPPLPSSSDQEEG